jgi:hypothetical protein
MKVLKRWGREIACEEFHLILHLLSDEGAVNAQLVGATGRIVTTINREQMRRPDRQPVMP